MWHSAHHAASAQTRTILRMHEGALVVTMAFGEQGRWEGLSQGLITLDSLLTGSREKGYRIKPFFVIKSTPDRTTVGGFDF